MGLFNNISLGRNNKRYAHHFSFDNDTTFNFGLVQPKWQMLVDDGDTIKCNFAELLRLAPLPVPTMGDVYQETYTRFVPAVEVCPWFSFIRAQKPYTFPNVTTNPLLSSSVIPARVPCISNAMLANFLMSNYCEFNIIALRDDMYSDGVYKGDYENVGASGYDWSYFVEQFGKFYASFGDAGQGVPYFSLPTPDQQFSIDTLTLNNADFVLPVGKDLLMFRLTPSGKQIRKVLIGLGYGLNINDNEPVSLLPLLAFYKAYYDTYNPSRLSSWVQTNCHSLIKFLEQDYLTTGCLYCNKDYWERNTNTVFVDLFTKFMSDLTNIYCTESLNYVSAHRDNPNNNLNYQFSSLSNEQTSDSVYLNPGNDNMLTPTLVKTNLSNVALQLLARVTRFANKDSVIGNKINTWLRVHGYGDLDNTLLRDSNKCSYHRLDAPITSLFSTADTVSADGKGEYLGSYAGKAIGSSQGNKFSYTAPSAGFFICFSCVKADSSFTNGNDGTLYCVDKDTLFIDEYDGLGYEITSKNELFHDGGFGYNPSQAQAGWRFKPWQTNLNDNGFGYIPRYSRMKQKRTIVNGDMSLRGTSANMSSYYLDKIVSNVDMIDDGQGHVEIYTTRIPEASEDFQFFNLYRWLGNYDRIFYNSGNLQEAPTDDNFISQSRYDITLINRMKPISKSYDTFDESHDNGDIDIQQS